MNIKKVTKRKYNPDCDFIRVRDFLAKTYTLWGKSINWTVERWNYARNFGVPMIGITRKAPPTVADSQKTIQFWEDHIRIWENSEQEVIAIHPLGTRKPGTDQGFSIAPVASIPIDKDPGCMKTIA